MTGYQLRAKLSALIVAVAASHNAVAESLEVARLMQMLAATPSAEVAFTEKKFSSLLAAPVVSTGKLSFRPPDTVEKTIETPSVDAYRFVGEDLIVTRNGAERRIRLSSQPMLAALAASLRGILAGNAAVLRNYFRLVLQGDEGSWRLDLIPLDEEIGRYVQRMTMSGRGGRLEVIEVREASGDHSVMQIQARR